MTDLTEKTTSLDEQSAVENSEEITQNAFCLERNLYSRRMEKQLYPRAIIGALSSVGCFEYCNKCIRFRFGDYVGFNLYKYRCFALS